MWKILKGQNFKNIFYLTQYTQSIITSAYKKYKNYWIRLFFKNHTKSGIHLYLKNVLSAQ